MANNDVSIRLTASDKTREAFDSVKRNLDGLSSAASGIGSLLSFAVPAISVAGIAGLVKSTIDAQDELAKLSQRTGVAVETLAGLQHAADLSGTEVEVLGKGVRKFSVIINEAAAGNKTYQDNLAQLGLKWQDLRKLAPEQQFYRLADAVARLSKEDRAAAVAGLLGDKMSKLVPLLSDGADGLRQMVEEGKRLNPVTEESARQAEIFNDNLDRLKKEAGQAAISLTVDLLPSLSDTAKAMEDLARSGHGVQAILRGIAGIGKIPFDLIFGDIKPAETAQQRIAELRQEISQLERNKASSGGKLLQKIFGTPEGIDRQILVLKNQIAALEKFGDQIYKPKPGKTAKDEYTPSLKTIGSSARASDPLASLLAQTDIGKLQAFDKQVALLNQRFDSGRKNTELYTQAMTLLVQRTFAGNWKQAADDAEFFRQVEADGIKTTLEWKQRLDELANVDMGRLNTLLANTDFARLRSQQEDMILLALAFSEGIKDADGNLRKLSESEYLDAVRNRLGLVGETAKTTGDALSEMAAQAGRNIQDAFAEFLFNPFDKGLKGMIQSFGQTIQKMVAQAVAADLAKRIFNWGDSGGGAGSLLGSIASVVFSGARASGGPVLGGNTYLVGEKGPELFTPSTSGSITPNNKLGGPTINVYVNGTNAPDVRRAAGQGMREAYLALQGAQRYA